MATFKIEIPYWHPITLNKLLSNWQRAARLKKSDKEIVWGYAWPVLCREGKCKTRRRVDLVITVIPKQRCPDKDSYWKSALDALVACGALVDDSPKWCEPGTVTFERGPRKKTVIILEDIS